MPRILKLIFSIVFVQLAGILGALFTATSIGTWYEMINKPVLNPPSWIFGPVWMVLYLLIGISLFLIWDKGVHKKHEKIAIEIFAIQLILNAIWSPIFFGLQNPGAAIIIIVLLWITIVATIVSFYKISKTAAYLLIPYLLWVSFATYLNYSIWVLN